IGVATMLLGTGIGDLATTRLVILAVVNAYALSRALICVVRALAGPFSLFRVRAETAAYIEIWARRIVTVAVAGIAFANVALLLQYFVGTIAVVLIMRLATILVLSLIDRGFRISPDLLRRFPGLETRANRYLPLLRNIVSAAIALIGFVALLEVWGVDAIVWFYGGEIGSRLLSALVSVGIAALAAAAIWEVSNALLDRKINALSREGHYARAARLRTFQPMLRTALLCLIVTVVGLTALSEIGVNVAPLLAGAGIVGIAIGFGSQKLVQDLITGLFLLLENTVQVGDNVTLSGLSGVVENVSIRTLRLR